MIKNAYILTLCLISISALTAQDKKDSAQKPAVAAPSVATTQDNSLKVFGLVRFRPELKENYNFDSVDAKKIKLKAYAGATAPLSGNSTYVYKAVPDRKDYVGQKVWLGVNKKFNDDVEAQILLQDARVWGGSDGAPSGLTTANSNSDEGVDVREAWIEVKNLLGPVALQAGRQRLFYGDQRLVGHLDWTNVGRSFDGVRFKYNSELLTSHLWYMNIGEEGTDFNAVLDGNETATKSNGASFTGFYNTLKMGLVNLDFYYFGRNINWQYSDNYYFYLDPSVGYYVPFADVNSVAITTGDRKSEEDKLNTFGLRLTNLTNDGKASGQFDFTLEYARQQGRTGKTKGMWGVKQNAYDLLGNPIKISNDTLVETPAGEIVNGTVPGADVTFPVFQAKEKYNAYAYAVDGGVKFGKVRLGGEVAYATGDHNPFDAEKGNFNNLVPTNHLHYGQADMVGWSNIDARSVNVTLPLLGGKLKLAVWDIDKANREDTWYNVAGAPTGEGTSCSGFTDYIDYTACKSFLKKDLFKEYDLTYTVKHKGITWKLSLSRMVADEAITDPKDDVVYKWLVGKGELSNLVDGVTPASPLKDLKLLTPTSKPIAHYASLMMEFKF